MVVHRRSKAHREGHLSSRAGWLRAVVLGADDAIVSTASLMIGVAASSASQQTILVAGLAGLVAGSTSMAVGEYVSVSSQRDAETADLARETEELAADPHAELNELAGIYVKRGLKEGLAMQVAEQLSEHDRLGAHMRDELGIEPQAFARPLQAAWMSAVSFASFALVPIAAMALAPARVRLAALAVVSLGALGTLGSFGGYLGGAPRVRAALRVTLGGAIAMAVSAGVGRLLGVTIG